MATYHIGSFNTATADAFSPTGIVRAVQENANGNKCVAYDDTYFSSWGNNSNKVQKVFPLPAGVYWTVMPLASNGPCLYCGFSTLSDLLNNAQFTPDLNGGALGGGVFADSDQVANFIAQIGGLLILPGGTPYTI